MPYFSSTCFKIYLDFSRSTSKDIQEGPGQFLDLNLAPTANVLCLKHTLDVDWESMDPLLIPLLLSLY